ncbi:MAG: T9SS type A sorting domain-containing protein, partial [Bacteroidota bacterium]
NLVARYELKNEVSVKDISNNEGDFKISPNPVNGYLTLNSNQKFYHIEIYSALGTKVFESEYHDRIDVSFLPSGLYFICQGYKVNKFVKM